MLQKLLENSHVEPHPPFGYVSKQGDPKKSGGSFGFPVERAPSKNKHKNIKYIYETYTPEKVHVEPDEGGSGLRLFAGEWSLR